MKAILFKYRHIVTKSQTYLVRHSDDRGAGAANARWIHAHLAERDIPEIEGTRNTLSMEFENHKA
jgi:hypothetical protein